MFNNTAFKMLNDYDTHTVSQKSAKYGSNFIHGCSLKILIIWTLKIIFRVFLLEGAFLKLFSIILNIFIIENSFASIFEADFF